MSVLRDSANLLIIIDTQFAYSTVSSSGYIVFRYSLVTTLFYYTINER